jgi:hypothetical protein
MLTLSRIETLPHGLCRNSLPPVYWSQVNSPLPPVHWFRTVSLPDSEKALPHVEQASLLWGTPPNWSGPS